MAIEAGNFPEKPENLNKNLRQVERKPGRKIPKSKVETISAMILAGKTYREIQEVVNVGLGTISSISKHLENSPEVEKLVSSLNKTTLTRKVIIAAKADQSIDRYFDAVEQGKKELNPVSASIISNNTFQQIRLLQDKSTDNISVASTGLKLLEELTKLKDERKNIIDSE